MFGTLRYDRQSHHAEFIDRTDSVLGDAATEHAACDKCRLTKLRCTGQRSGCDRCRVRGIQCVYSATGSRQSKKTRKADGTADSKVKKPPQKRLEKPHVLKSTVLGKKKQTAGGRRKAANLREKTDEAVSSPEKLEQDTDQEIRTAPVYRVADLLLTWPHGHDPVLDLQMPPSPLYDGLPETVVLDTKFPGASYHELNPDGSVDDGSYAFFTSESSPSSWAASSEATSPMFTDTPTTPQGDNTGLRMPFTVDNNNQTANCCNCLGVISNMLEELDELVSPPVSLGLDTGPRHTVDRMLGTLKTQMANANKVVQCSLCQHRSEHISLLIRACETMVRFAERIVVSYLGKRRQETTYGPIRTAMVVADSTPPPTPAPSPSDSITMARGTAADSHVGGNASGLGSINPAMLDTSCPFPGSDSTTGTEVTENNLSGFINNETQNLSDGDLFFGGYKTDPSEYEALMNVLIGLQLKGLVALLASLQRQNTPDTRTGISLTAKQVSRLHASESVVEGLVLRLEEAPQSFLGCH